MASLDTDTIAAIATPNGRGGIGVVRVSGPAAAEVCRAITGSAPPAPRQASLVRFRDAQGAAVDQGLVVWFAGPNSYTGEDVVEFQGHGGPVLMDLLLGATVAGGARLARPGEFSERAYLNGKLDLAQAEAVADLIDGATQAAVRGAMRSLDGEFSARIDALAERLRELRAYVEAAIDFPEEEVDFLAQGEVGARLADVSTAVNEVLGATRSGAMLAEGLTVVLGGAPNVGKSSLLNRLAGQERAIVTEVPGTTRDVLSAEMDLDGVRVRLVDTAGLRASDDPVEREGVRRAQQALATADLVLLVSDASDASETEGPTFSPELAPNAKVLIVENKIDLPAARDGAVSTGADTVRVSALTGAGLEDLVERLRQALGVANVEAGAFTARRRHVEALNEVARRLDEAATGFATSAAGEILAEDLRLAHDTLGEITGKVSADELLGDIFGRFCIGK